jgi:hypothetical protein
VSRIDGPAGTGMTPPSSRTRPTGKHR